MRRNFRGGGRGGQRWHQNSPGVSGPLRTDHLGLQDIDKELELLQRKREIIEQQQQILSNEFRRNDYQEPFSQSSPFDDYAQSYANSRDYNPPSRKRPITVWEDDVPSKRFSGPVRPKHRPYTEPAIPPLMRSGPLVGYQPRPLSGPFKPKPPKKVGIPPKKVAIPTKKDVIPPKVAKTAGAPGKPKNPVADRKKDVADIDLTSEVSAPANEWNRLKADREPCKQLTGRLELALGCIIKDIKTNAIDPSVLKPTAVMRDVKMTVRDRIRELMMDQVVGSADSVKARYREVYDHQSDCEIIANAIDAQTGQVTLFKIDEPEKYFKANMHRIMLWKLKSLFDKLEETARAEVKSKTAGLGDARDARDAPENKLDENLEAEKYSFNENMINTYKYKQLEKWMTVKITGVIKKFFPFILKLMDIDGKYNRLKNTITTETVKMLIHEKQVGDTPAAPVETGVVSMRTLNAPLNISTTPKTPRTPYKPLPYFAKLMGKPSLPKRNQMEKFFELYNPKSIKKHRTMHNLLFVGFLEKESYEAMLAANGTVMGRYTLSIRPSERSNPEVVKKDPNISVSSEEELIGPKLDEQITDLLLSIRKTESGDENGEWNTENVDEKDGVKQELEENSNADGPTADVDGTIADVDDITAEADVTTADADVTTADDDVLTADDDGSYADDIKMDGNNATADNVDADTNINKSEMADADNNGSTEKLDDILLEEMDVAESGKGDAEELNTKKEDNVVAEESADQVPSLAGAKASGCSTPAKASARQPGTPGRVMTRRASKLLQNDA